MTSIIWDTPLPKGYSDEAIYLRRWILDNRLRLICLENERKAALEAALIHICRKAGYGTSKNKKRGPVKNGNVSDNARALAKLNG